MLYVMPVKADYGNENMEEAKALFDANKSTFGFITRGALVQSAAKCELWMLGELNGDEDEGLQGVMRFHVRRDGWVTLYEILVSEKERGCGRGTRLLNELKALGKPIRLKCPVGERANSFYLRNGFTLAATVEGKKRALNVWEWR